MLFDYQNAPKDALFSHKDILFTKKRLRDVLYKMHAIPSYPHRKGKHIPGPIAIVTNGSQSICEGVHDEVIKWKHFPRYWPFVRGIHRSPMNSAHKGQ